MAIRFDLSAVPDNANIINAELSLYCAEDYYPAAVNIGYLFRISQDWSPSSATWTQRTASEAWSLMGGDFILPHEFQVDRSGTDVKNTWETYAVTGAIRTFMADPDSNFGFLLTVGNYDGHAYLSSENSEVSLRPKLTIVYENVSIEALPEIPVNKPEITLVSEQVIVFNITKAGPFSLQLFDIAGRKLWSHRNSYADPGLLKMEWNGSKFSRHKSANQRYFMVLNQGTERAARIYIPLK